MGMKTIYLLIPLLPLFAAVVVGLFGRKLPRSTAHVLTIAAVAVSFGLSVGVLLDILKGAAPPFNDTIYTWLTSGNIRFEVGFLIDQLSAMMMVVVTFVSLMVHIYTIGYMRDDPGYSRFFSYISLFTFSMLMLVMSNNFMQLFFGWEAVGLVSYLLIGFWFKRPTAIYANLKAFLVNRVGDFGFLLGIGLILYCFESLDYASVFLVAPQFTDVTVTLIPGLEWSLLTVICILLFIGAMGKSAQVPLHVWLPDSMEGPTPISALIHAATMVTAGIFMVARMSPLYELSTTALSFVLVIGAITALLMAFLGIIQNDIKRVVAYSTLSQLGYMTVALGVSAYSAAIFHLMTHAFFKALLFLGAGSVIIAMHHDQDLRRMGGLRKYLPVTYITAVIGSLALAGIPPFAGFFSKDAIIEAVGVSHTPGAGLAYFAVMAGVFVTAFYSFRLLFLAFHGKERFGHAHEEHHDDDHSDDHDDEHHGLAPGEKPRESPWVVTLPLILLAIPSVIAGLLYIKPMLFGSFFGNAITVRPEHDVLQHIGTEFHGWFEFMLHGMMQLPFWLAIAGIASAWYLYLVRPDFPAAIQAQFHRIYRVLDNKYYFDAFYVKFFAGGARCVGNLLWKIGDVQIIDGFVNGLAHSIGRFAGEIRRLQSGLIYHYAFAMIIGALALLTWFMAR
ncbi:MAG: NADH-quinone oxidoreductase subunit L [Methylobacillus sp.]|jgi:NADH-quinone oxidoreductase subunit L|nr:NADH-quinone oxidoreductase subunit L [Methylobacillus sp.]